MKTSNKKTTLLLIIVSILMSCSYSDTDKKYSLSLKGNNLYITMPHPTLGLAGINMVDWRGVSLSEVCEDVYQTLNESSISGECFFYVRFDDERTDKYGNPTHNFDEFLIARIPIVELRKYKGSKYLDDSYSISDNIYNAAFHADTYETPEKSSTQSTIEWYDPDEITDSLHRVKDNLNPTDSVE